MPDRWRRQAADSRWGAIRSPIRCLNANRSRIGDNGPMLANPPRAAGAVVFRRAGSGLRILVLRAFGIWDFPKGLLEPGETEFVAAQREVLEETGLTDLDYPFGEGTFKDTLPYSGGKIARFYLAETGTAAIALPGSPELGRPEHDDWRWVSLEEAEDLLPPRLAIVLDWVRGRLAAH